MQTETMHVFPPYRPPWGLPAAWRDDVSGVLPAVVMAYHAAALNDAPPLNPAQLELLRSYLEYVITAPCWRDSDQGEIAALRRRIATARTVAAIDRWLDACLAIGIDPL
jgi:hypothetical protein